MHFLLVGLDIGRCTDQKSPCPWPSVLLGQQYLLLPSPWQVPYRLQREKMQEASSGVLETSIDSRTSE